MNTHYRDILDRIREAPLWFDEEAVPRFERFSPRLLANIYADEAALLRIECQACERLFDVAVSSSLSQRTIAWAVRGRSDPAPNARDHLANEIRGCAIDYGDPPNVACCPAGPTMTAVPLRVVEYWRRERMEWVRDRSLEVGVSPEWAQDEPGEEPS